jgi:hypothetical protein
VTSLKLCTFNFGARIPIHTSDPDSDSKYCQLIGQYHVVRFQRLADFVLIGERELEMAGRVAVDADEIRKFDEAELAEWLEEKDIPREFCEKLESKHTLFIV